MTILMTILGLYACWVLLGYLAFRLLVAVNDGRCLIKEYSSDRFSKPLTPKNGVQYMFLGGAVMFVVIVISMTIKGIKKAYKKQFSDGINHSMGANRFFGLMRK